MKNFLVKNYKTSIAGALLAIVAYVSYEGLINPGQTALITALLASLGNFLSKDADTTGVSHPRITIFQRETMDPSAAEGKIFFQEEGDDESPAGYYKVFKGAWVYLGVNS